jgi:hypothetical protein
MSTRKSVKTPVESKLRKPSLKKTIEAPSREEISKLAQRYWNDRGRLDGHAEQDWHRAEQELLAQAS